MYLTHASHIDEVLDYGVQPAIEFLNIAQDARDAGDDDRAAMFEIEAKAKLHLIKQALNRIRCAEHDDSLKPSFFGGKIRMA